MIFVPSKVSYNSRRSAAIPIVSTHAVGNVTLQVFEPLAAVPPAELILILAVRRSMFSPLLYYILFGTNNQELSESANEEQIRLLIPYIGGTAAIRNQKETKNFDCANVHKQEKQANDKGRDGPSGEFGRGISRL